VSYPANPFFSFYFRQKNTSVKELDLSGNDIGNEGAKAIERALKVGASIQRGHKASNSPPSSVHDFMVATACQINCALKKIISNAQHQSKFSRALLVRVYFEQELI